MARRFRAKAKAPEANVSLEPNREALQWKISE